MQADKAEVQRLDSERVQSETVERPQPGVLPISAVEDENNQLAGAHNLTETPVEQPGSSDGGEKEEIPKKSGFFHRKEKDPDAEPLKKAKKSFLERMKIKPKKKKKDETVTDAVKDDLTCEYCKYKTKSKSALISHKDKVHGDAESGEDVAEIVTEITDFLSREFAQKVYMAERAKFTDAQWAKNWEEVGEDPQTFTDFWGVVTDEDKAKFANYVRLIMLKYDISTGQFPVEVRAAICYYRVWGKNIVACKLITMDTVSTTQTLSRIGSYLKGIIRNPVDRVINANQAAKEEVTEEVKTDGNPRHKRSWLRPIPSRGMGKRQEEQTED